MISVLVYPNITYARNLEADSYIVAVGGMIRALNRVRDDLEFTMLLPDHVESLELPNVEQVHYPLPTYPNTMRAHFDTEAFLRAVSWKTRSYDIVWSHLPEHTLAMKNVFYNGTNERPVFVGYSHWFEVPENTEYLETLLAHNLHGILAMEECAVNSQWLRDLVLEHAGNILAPPLWEQLKDRLTVQYLGADVPDAPRREPEPGRLVFNHRANAYTGWTQTLAALDLLWEARQDFRLVTTLADADRPYIERIEAPDRVDYLTELSRCWAGIGAFRKYSAWSVSVTDGMSMGVPYVLPNDLVYPEMVGHDYPGLYPQGKAGMVAAIERVLDASRGEREALADYGTSVVNALDWDQVVQVIDNMFDDAIDALPIAKPTDSYHKALSLAEGRSKKDLLKEMGWGVRVPWTGYRNRLRQDGVDTHVDCYGDKAEALF